MTPPAPGERRPYIEVVNLRSCSPTTVQHRWTSSRLPHDYRALPTEAPKILHPLGLREQSLPVTQS